MHSYSVDARVLRITTVRVDFYLDYLVRLFRLILQFNFIFSRIIEYTQEFFSTNEFTTTNVKLEAIIRVFGLSLPELRSIVTEERYCRT